MTSIVDASHYLFTSESVTEGHPDKLCDQVSDAILDAFIRADPEARVACESATTTGLVMVLGEISTKADFVDVPTIVRETVRDIGYTKAEYGFDYLTCGTLVSIKEQSSDIAQGVDEALETRDDAAPAHELGAGDQGMMFGFACRETPELMPLPIALAHRMARRLAEVRKSGQLPYLRPDGKTQVTVEYEHGVAKRVRTVVVSAQHDPDVRAERLRSDIVETVIRPTIPAELRETDPIMHVNPTGRFVIGGPMGDAGPYRAQDHRRLATAGWPATAAARSPARTRRRSTGPARTPRAGWRRTSSPPGSPTASRSRSPTASASPGRSRSRSSRSAPARSRTSRSRSPIDRHFDLRPASIISALELRQPIYRQTAAYGHFGRPDLDLPWERTDKAALLASEAGVRQPEPVSAG